MRVAISGSSGLIGSALRESLTADGHDVLRLVRRDARSPDEVSWPPADEHAAADALHGVDAVVNLAGSPVVARPWTARDRRTFRESRLRTTSRLAGVLAGMDRPPAVLVSGSGSGYYGGASESPVAETHPPGDGFMARLCVEWEGATSAAASAGVRVCLIRTGIVLSRHGGALGRMVPLFRAGLGGRLGNGRQWWSVIALADQVRAIRFLLESEGCEGAYNLAAPEAVRNREFTALLARQLHRPAVLPAPAFAIRLALGEFAHEVLGTTRLDVGRLTDAGFVHHYPAVADALRAGLA